MSFRTCLPAVGITALLATPAFSATTNIFQVSVSANVEQEITTLRGDPNFYDEANTNIENDEDRYLFFDEHINILTDYGNGDIVPWDPSQIPSAPDRNLEGQPYGVISEGILNATWTFDAGLLARDLSDTGLTEEGATLLGVTSNVSNFEVIALGESVGNAVTTISRVYAANNVVLGEGGEMLDVIGIEADGGTLDGGETNGIVLILGGDSNWFEDAAGGIPDFEESIVAGFVEFQDLVFASDNSGPLYEEFITGDLTGADLAFRDFGAADGASEESPLLPGEVSVSDEGEAPTFSFDVSVAGADFVFIDPEVAVGYTYVLSGDGRITGIKAPTLDAVNDADGYIVTLPDGQQFRLLPGEEIELLAGVQVVTASGDVVTPGADITTLEFSEISELLGIDPLDTTTFVAGFRFADTSTNSSFSQTALIIDTDDPVSAVPLPPSMALILAGLGGLGVMKRRRKIAA